MQRDSVAAAKMQRAFFFELDAATMLTQFFLVFSFCSKRSVHRKVNGCSRARDDASSVGRVG